jgi:hypothetical protein
MAEMELSGRSIAGQDDVGFGWHNAFRIADYAITVDASHSMSKPLDFLRSSAKTLRLLPGHARQRHNAR